MDPLSLSGAFATIVGLLVSFKGERSGSDLSEFMSWLKDNHQEQIALSISKNAELSSELSSLLSTNHDELIFRLNAINEQISRIVFQFDGFSGMANVFSPLSVLSDQAKSVLRQIVESKADMVMEHKLGTGRPSQFIFIGGNTRGEVQFSESQFIDEDLESLVNAKLLRSDRTPKGDRRFYSTRLGVEYSKNSG